MPIDIRIASCFSSILAASAINIRNIGINNARDMDEYALRISFYDKKSMDHAVKRLEDYNFRLSVQSEKKHAGTT